MTVNGIEHIEMLPVMDFKNSSIPLEQITSFDVNKAIQRSLTKAVARHGLGLYIYAGEDLPEGEDEKQKGGGSFMTKGKEVSFTPTCAGCGASITDAEHDFSVKRYGKPLCRACQKKVTANGS